MQLHPLKARCCQLRGDLREDIAALTQMGKVKVKTVLLGDSGVGKTSIAVRLARDVFNDRAQPTVGAAFFTFVVENAEDSIQFEMWDTAGQERYRSLAPMYYRGAEVAIVVYDITSFKSFEGAKNWVRDLKLYGQPNVVIALAANKCDLDAQFREVSAQEGQAYARDEDMAYFETSAKTAHNVRAMFVALAKRVPRTKDASLSGTPLDSGASTTKSGGCC